MIDRARTLQQRAEVTAERAREVVLHAELRCHAHAARDLDPETEQVLRELLTRG